MNFFVLSSEFSSSCFNTFRGPSALFIDGNALCVLIFYSHNWNRAAMVAFLNVTFVTASTFLLLMILCPEMPISYL
jgi:hypothetical protein